MKQNKTKQNNKINKINKTVAAGLASETRDGEIPDEAGFCGLNEERLGESAVRHTTVLLLYHLLCCLLYCMIVVP